MSASTSERLGVPAEPSAFDAGHRGAEAHGLDFALAFGQRQRKAAVKGVAGANRVYGSDAEYRQAPHRVALEIEDVFRPVAHGDERVGIAYDVLEAFGEIGRAGRLAQALRRKDDGVSPSEIADRFRRFDGRRRARPGDAGVAPLRRSAARNRESSYRRVGRRLPQPQRPHRSASSPRSARRSKSRWCGRRAYS